MNHFFLWIGRGSGKGAAGAALLRHFKATGPVSVAEGSGWALAHAPQRDALAAFPDDRQRLLPGTGPVRRMLWFGHCWSDADGAQPAFSRLAACPDEAGNVCRIQAVREQTDGVYALILIDEAAREVVVGADALGSFHVYYRTFGDGVAVSNSSAVLAALPPASALDPLGVQELCSNAVANEDRSLWSAVRKLRACHLLRIDAGSGKPELVVHRPLLAVVDGITGYDADPVPRLFESISSALQPIARHGARGGDGRSLPWVADLTGGNDSRALMAALVANRLNVASTVSGPADDPDVLIGAHLAAILGLKHFPRPPAPVLDAAGFFDAARLTDCEFDAVEYSAVAAVHRQHIRDGLQFSLNGSYGELARGHAWRMGLPGMLFPDQVAAGLKARGALSLDHPSVDRWNRLFTLKNPDNLFAADARDAGRNHFAGMFGRLKEYAGHLPQHAQLDLIHADLRMERWLGRLLSSTNQIWPAMSPWGFQGPLAQILTASPTIRRNGLLTRAFTLAYAPALAREPLYTGNPAMPFSLAQAHRFWPLVPYFADRAQAKILSRFRRADAGASLPAAARQPLLCGDPEIGRWLDEPLLAGSGLFEADALHEALAAHHPRSSRGYQLWCRLLTVENALRAQAAAPVTAPDS